MANFEIPALGEYQTIPHLKPGTMAHSKPFVAKPEIQKPLGFPGELVENWEQKAVAKLGELVSQSHGSACTHQSSIAVYPPGLASVLAAALAVQP